MVVAETKRQARDAAERVDGRLRGAARRHRPGQGAWTPARRSSIRRRRSNLIFDWELGDEAAADAALAKAAHVVKLDIVNNRLVPNAMEPRAALGVYDPAEEHFTLWTTHARTRMSHRLVISAFYDIAPENKLRVIAPDVGGGFGSKIFIYPEEIVCLWASKKSAACR